jgi:hypothetical protein
MGEVSPVVIWIIRGLLIYGSVILFAGGAFQVYRHEKKSAYFLFGTSLFLIMGLVAGMLLRRQ